MQGVPQRPADRRPHGDGDGVKLQYLTAGTGPAIVLLHGYAETSRMWRPLIPRLATTLHRDRARPAGDRRIGHSEPTVWTWRGRRRASMRS